MISSLTFPVGAQRMPVIVTSQWMEQGNMSLFAQLVPSWFFIMTEIKWGVEVKPGP